MPTDRPALRVVAGRGHRTDPEPRMSVAAQAIFAGPQDMRVTAMTPEVTGRGYGHVVMRVGRLLIYLEDRDALEAWQAALEQASEFADRAFGLVPPPALYRPRRR